MYLILSCFEHTFFKHQFYIKILSSLDFKKKLIVVDILFALKINYDIPLTIFIMIENK